MSPAPLTPPRLTAEQAAVVEANLGLVGHVIGRMGIYGDSHDDAYQDGVLGLMRAAQKYDPAKARFSTYACIWIRQAIGRGHEMAEGRSYRYAREHGLEWSAPLSLDAVLGDGDDYSLADFLAVPVDEHDQEQHDVVASLLADDEGARLARLFGAKGVDVARAEGVTTQAIHLRRKRSLPRLRELARRVAS